MAHCWVLRQQDREGFMAYGLWAAFRVLFVSGFLAAPIMLVSALFVGLFVWGVWFGVVV